MHEVPVYRESLDWQFAEPAAVALHAAEWDGLVAAGHYPAFMRAMFLEQSLRAFGCRHGRLILGRKQGRLVVAALLVLDRWGRWASYQPSQLPLGAWVMARGCRWEDVLPSLARTLPGLAVSVSVTQQDPLFAERPASGSSIEALDYVPTGWVEVRGSFDDFWAARGKNLRQNLRKQRRRLEEQGSRLVFEFVESPEAVDAAFLEFASLESAGWKAAQGTAITADNAQGAFYRNILANAAAEGGAFAFRLALDDRAIAIDFGLRDADTLVILKTTYDETIRACSPAQLLHEKAFECIFERRLAHTVEFYGKVMEWHTRWTDKSRMLYHVEYFRVPVLRWVRGALRNRKSEQASATAVRGRG